MITGPPEEFEEEIAMARIKKEDRDRARMAFVTALLILYAGVKSGCALFILRYHFLFSEEGTEYFRICS